MPDQVILKFTADTTGLKEELEKVGVVVKKQSDEITKSASNQQKEVTTLIKSQQTEIGKLTKDVKNLDKGAVAGLAN